MVNVIVTILHTFATHRNSSSKQREREKTNRFGGFFSHPFPNYKYIGNDVKG